MPLQPFSIGTLNCRSLEKKTDSSKHIDLTTHLKLLSHSILALTETKTADADITILNRNLGARESVWTTFCGLVVRDQRFSVLNSFSGFQGRALFVTLSSPDPTVNLHICTIYAPAHNSTERNRFFSYLLTLPFFTEPQPNSILLGDFNYQFHKRHRTTVAWSTWLQDHMQETITPPSQSSPFPTFQQGERKSTIDFIFSSPDLFPHFSSPNVDFLPPGWTDHALVSATVTLQSEHGTGPGVWRLNVSILDHDDFQPKLFKALDSLLTQHNTQTPQQRWDRLKEGLKVFFRRYTKDHQKQLRRQRRRLQKKRRLLLLDLDNPDLTLDLADRTKDRLLSVEAEIAEETERLTDGYRVRSGLKWLEKGERSSQYFFATLKERLKKRTMTALLDPDTQELAHTADTMIPIAHKFYRSLYSPDRVRQQNIDSLLTHLPDNQRLTQPQHDALNQIPTQKELDVIMTKAPKGRSPGLDGLPFEVYDLLFAHDATNDLFTQVLREAVTLSRFPKSWRKTVMVLLFKKGEATSLENWRPLSLVNCDAKIYTKLFANRLRDMLPTLVGKHQTGFIQGRSILDNGLTMANMMDWAKAQRLPHACVLLDQAKAYDRIHRKFLLSTLRHMNFPDTFIKSISSLFFTTQVHLNINGYIAPPFTQARGLRQGDPLSPLLFNLAFEVFLAAVQASEMIKGIKISDDLWIKLIAYADDLAVYVASYEEWQELKRIFDEYGLASNARLNVNKTLVFPMQRGATAMKAEFTQEGVQWYDHETERTEKYLGFPIVCDKKQLDNFFNTMLEKIQATINIHSQRQLSIAGRSLIINALLLARLWHVVRIYNPTKAWIKQLRTALSRFAMPFFPRPSMDTAEAPKEKGGLGIINVHHQQTTFALTILQHMISKSDSLSMVVQRRIIEIRTQKGSWMEAVLDPHNKQQWLAIRPFKAIKHLFDQFRTHVLPVPVLPLPQDAAQLEEILTSLPVGSNNLGNMTKKQWRQVLYTHTLNTMQQGTASFWNGFWKSSVPQRSRNILWRYLDSKLSCKKTLNYFTPRTCPSPLCTECDSEEDQDHLLVTCINKSTVWQEALAEHTVQHLWPNQSIVKLLSTTPPTVTMKRESVFTLFQLVSAITLGIWNQHWTHHFQDTPVDPTALSNSVKYQIHRLRRQLLLRVQL